MHLLVAEEKQAHMRKGSSLGTAFPASPTLPRAASACLPRPAPLLRVRLKVSQRQQPRQRQGTADGGNLTPIFSGSLKFSSCLGTKENPCTWQLLGLQAHPWEGSWEEGRTLSLLRLKAVLP